MEIKRNYYLNKLIESQNDGLVKIITGIRRCGKSYLLNHIFYNYLIDNLNIKKENIIQLDLDRIENKKYLNGDELFNFIKTKLKSNEKYYIMLDEVQLVSNFEMVLNSFIDYSNVDIYVTGSNSKFLSKDIVTEFRGRGEEIRVYPLSFSEFIEGYNGDKNDAWIEYITYGGLPEIRTKINTTERKMNYLEYQLQNVYINDVIDRNSISNNKDILNTLLQIVASSIGSLTNPLKLSNSFKSLSKTTLSSNTIANYLKYFEDAFIIENSKKYDIKGKKYINSPSKYYFTDIGIRNEVLGFRQFEETHIMENIIYNELRKRNFRVDVGQIEHRNIENGEKNFKLLEIDFIAIKGNNKIYIQSALTIGEEKKKQQEIQPLLLLRDSFRKIVVTKDNIPNYIDENGIEYINLFNFLNDMTLLN